MPAQVTRGSTANTTPAVTATDRVDSCLPSTTHTCGGHADRQCTRQPGEELSRGENCEPAVHQQVIQPVNSVDVAQHSQQFGYGAGAGGDRRRFVEPKRRRAAPAALMMTVSRATATASDGRAGRTGSSTAIRGSRAEMLAGANRSRRRSGM